MDKVITSTGEVIETQQQGLSVNFSKHQLTQMREQRELLNSFIKYELLKNIDYGTIQGTSKPTLYKPGAEKLRKLFGMGSKIIESKQEIDMANEWAWFTYRISIFDLRTGIQIADCEGSSNSKEKKNLNRAIPDLINTMQKMAQKRAFVGAIIQATGASDFFTHDIEDMDLSDKNNTDKPFVNSTSQSNIVEKVLGVTTEKQQKRLYAITKQANWSQDMSSEYMIKNFNITDSRSLNIKQYDQICKHIETHPVKLSNMTIDTDQAFEVEADLPF